MDVPLVTIVVVVRERFSVAQRALEALYANTPEPFRLVYVDAGSPGPLRRYLAAQARLRGFQIVRRAEHINNNQSRNIALAHLGDTPYVVFLDNDAVVEPGWLGALLRAAEETGAAAVGPLYLLGEPGSGVIHVGAGDSHFVTEAGRRRFVERHRFANQRVDAVRDRLTRERCETVEFHCMLVRRDVLERVGPFDEGLHSMAEHTDFCLRVREHGGAIYLEPAAAVTYVIPGRLSLADLRFFWRRWSDAWTDATVARFCEKWGVDPQERGMRRIREHARSHRHLALEPLHRLLVRWLGWRWGHWLGHGVARGLEIRLNRWWVRAPAPAAASAPAPGSAIHRAQVA
jgi:GT2 family glycosyltransferase